MGENQSAVVLEPPGFRCTQCGDCCCGFSADVGVLLFPEDIEQLSHGLGVSKATFLGEYTRGLASALLGTPRLPALVHEEGRCVFLTGEGRCGIHAFKPTQCRRTPFSFFWDGERSYECMKGVPIPEDWTSVDLDRDLVQCLLETHNLGGDDYGEVYSCASKSDSQDCG